jgi:hypothetical protein
VKESTLRKRTSKLLLLIPLVLFIQAYSCQSKSVATEHDFAVAIAAAQKVEIAVYQNKQIPDDIHAQIQQGFLKAGALGEAVNASLAAKAGNQTIVAQLQVLKASLTTLLNNGTLGIKDPNAQAAWGAAMQGAITIVSNLIIQLGGTV